jgi:hypothetical protein
MAARTNHFYQGQTAQGSALPAGPALPLRGHHLQNQALKLHKLPHTPMHPSSLARPPHPSPAHVIRSYTSQLQLPCPWSGGPALWGEERMMSLARTALSCSFLLQVRLPGSLGLAVFFLASLLLVFPREILVPFRSLHRSLMLHWLSCSRP